MGHANPAESDDRTAPGPAPAPSYLAASLAGRCANGHERDQGRRVHAVPFSDTLARNGYVTTPAACGAKPGARSAGWSHHGQRDVTCPRCAQKLQLPTHWMDDRGLIVTAEFLRDRGSSSDWHLAYTIPCRMVRGRIVRLGTTVARPDGPPRK